MGLTALVNSPTPPLYGYFHEESFWHPNWGASVVHKGVDVFAPKGTPVVSATHGIVIQSKRTPRGGEVVTVAAPPARMYYYAHLSTRAVKYGQVVMKGDTLGTVGDTGNAVGKSPHLHYAVATLYPRPWAIREGALAHESMFFVDPTRHLVQ